MINQPQKLMGVENTCPMTPSATGVPAESYADNRFSKGEKEFPSHLMDDGSLDSSHDGSVDSSLAMDQPH